MAIAERPPTLTEKEIDSRVCELLTRPYRMVVQGEPEDGYVAEAPELPGCFTAGDTPEEAMALLRDAMAAWFEVRLQDNVPIPDAEPEQEYSGKFNVRLPKSLHRVLARRAEQEGVSLNTQVVTLLSRSLVSRLGQ